MSKKKRDFTGSRFGRLTVLREAPKRENSPNSVWVAACECGNEIQAFSHNLVAGRTLSCGCFKLERLKETAAKRVAAVKAYWAKYRLETRLLKAAAEPNLPQLTGDELMAHLHQLATPTDEPRK